MIETNDLNPLVTLNTEPKMDRVRKLSDSSPHTGRPKGTSSLHAKHPSAIAKRLKLKGIDWIDSFAVAIKTNDKELLSLWVRLMPYLIVTQGHKQVKRRKGRASKAALEALQELENE